MRNLRVLAAIAAACIAALIVVAIRGGSERRESASADASGARVVEERAEPKRDDASMVADADDASKQPMSAAATSEDATRQSAAPVSAPAAAQTAAPAKAKEETIRVQVLDALQHPVGGVPVILRVHAPGQDPPQVDIHRVLTSTDTGIALLGCPRKIVEKMGKQGVTARLEIACDLPEQPSLSLPLTNFDCSEELYTLVLPLGAEVLFTPVTVQVVDGSGTPQAGVSVELVAVSIKGIGPRTVGKSVKTSAQGLAQFARDEQMLYSSKMAERGQACDFYVRCPLPALVRPQVAVPKPAKDQPPLRIVLPPTGRAIVEVVDGAGAPVADGTYVALWWRDPVKSESESAFISGRDSNAQVASGRAIVERVGLGLELQARCQVEREFDQTGSVTFRGPASAGEDVTIKLQLETNSHECALTARMLDEERKPIANQSIWINVRAKAETPESLQQGRNPGQDFPKRTDADGRVRVVLGVSNDEAYVVEFREKDHWMNLPSQRCTVVELAQMPAAGATLDLGDRVLLVPPPAPVLVAGTVVDEANQPIRFASVTLYGFRDGEHAQPWRALHMQPVPQTDKAGNFEVRAGAPTRKLMIEVGARGYAPAKVADIEAGSRNVRVVLRKESIVRGRVLTDTDAFARGLEAVLVGTSGSRDINVGNQGVFRFENVSAGTYRLEIWLDPGHWQLVAIENVITHEGEKLEDPRLAEIDLRGKLRHLRLALQTPAGQPASRRVWIRDEQGQGDSFAANHDGRIEVLVPASIANFVVTGSDDEAIPVQWSEQELVVVLKR